MSSLFRIAVVAAMLLTATGCASEATSPSASAQVIGPIILDTTQTSATVPVGRTVVFNVENPGAWTLAAEPTELVALSAGGEQGGAVLNPGAEALKPGVVEVTLTNSAAGETLVFQLTITE